MSSDMTVACDDGLIHIRVGAIILNDGKFLMVGNERSDYLYSVGGRIKFGETAEEEMCIRDRDMSVDAVFSESSMIHGN